MKIKKDRTNETNYNTHGTLMKIIQYNNAVDIIVEFQDEYKVKVSTRYELFKNGKVRNPYDKTVYNIGYVGEGKYKISINNKNTKCYEVWIKMLQRCYDAYYINKHLTYIDCFTCNEWHNFQNFAKWFYKNYYECNNERMELDKDILVKGSKIYSPNTCIFVPQRINKLFTKRQSNRGKYPIGVRYDKKSNLLSVSCSIINRKEYKYLGSFPTNRPFQAFTCYKTFKESYIKQVADEYKDLIPQKLYEALYKYEVEIND